MRRLLGSALLLLLTAAGCRQPRAGVVVEGVVGKQPITLRVVDRIRLIDGLASERYTFTDPTLLLLAVLRTPRLWWTALRWVIGNIR